MNLILRHFHATPETGVTNFGMQSDKIRNVREYMMVFRNCSRITFFTREDREIAEMLTGWQPWDVDTLEVSYQDDLIYMPASHQYFSDLVIEP